MTATIMSLKNTVINWADIIEYSRSGINSKVLLEDGICQRQLMSLASGTHIAEHAVNHNATVHVIEGQGVLNLAGVEIVLQSGVFAFVPANTRHSIEAMTNLSFLLTLSE